MCHGGVVAKNRPHWLSCVSSGEGEMKVLLWGDFGPFPPVAVLPDSNFINSGPKLYYLCK